VCACVCSAQEEEGDGVAAAGKDAEVVKAVKDMSIKDGQKIHINVPVIRSDIFAFQLLLLPYLTFFINVPIAPWRRRAYRD
jgi:hypothetical protein